MMISAPGASCRNSGIAWIPARASLRAPSPRGNSISSRMTCTCRDMRIASPSSMVAAAIARKPAVVRSCSAMALVSSLSLTTSTRGGAGRLDSLPGLATLISAPSVPTPLLGSAYGPIVATARRYAGPTSRSGRARRGIGVVQQPSGRRGRAGRGHRIPLRGHPEQRQGAADGAAAMCLGRVRGRAAGQSIVHDRAPAQARARSRGEPRGLGGRARLDHPLVPRRALLLGQAGARRGRRGLAVAGPAALSARGLLAGPRGGRANGVDRARAATGLVSGVHGMGACRPCRPDATRSGAVATATDRGGCVGSIPRRRGSRGRAGAGCQSPCSAKAATRGRRPPLRKQLGRGRSAARWIPPT